MNEGARENSGPTGNCKALDGDGVRVAAVRPAQTEDGGRAHSGSASLISAAVHGYHGGQVATPKESVGFINKRGRRKTQADPGMRIESPRRRSGWHGGPALTTLAALAMVAVVLTGTTWAKASRYDLRAVPSPHFSKSVKMARVPTLEGLGAATDALAAVKSAIPEPEWSGIAPLPAPETASGAIPLPFPRFRAPPTAV